MQTKGRSLKVIQASEGLHFNVMGAMMTYKATIEDTGAAYSLAVEVTPPDMPKIKEMAHKYGVEFI